MRNRIAIFAATIAVVASLSLPLASFAQSDPPPTTTNGSAWGSTSGQTGDNNNGGINQTGATIGYDSGTGSAQGVQGSANLTGNGLSTDLPGGAQSKSILSFDVNASGSQPSASANGFAGSGSWGRQLGANNGTGISVGEGTGAQFNATVNSTNPADCDTPTSVSMNGAATSEGSTTTSANNSADGLNATVSGMTIGKSSASVNFVQGTPSAASIGVTGDAGMQGASLATLGKSGAAGAFNGAASYSAQNPTGTSGALGISGMSTSTVAPGGQGAGVSVSVSSNANTQPTSH